MTASNMSYISNLREMLKFASWSHNNVTLNHTCNIK